MNRKAIIKRLVLYTSMVPVLFMLTSSNLNKKGRAYHRANVNIEKGKIEYPNRTIFIGDEDYIKEMMPRDNDILAIDERISNDPNIKIMDSYKIEDPLVREAIIEGLLYYEELFPSEWNRSRISMDIELVIHNIMYHLGYDLNSTRDVDFNNSDEKVYRLKK